MGELHPLRVVTTLDAIYEFPDMLDFHVQELMANLEHPTERIVIRNVSEEVLMLPFRIISRVEIVEARGRDGEDYTNVIWRRE